MGIALLKLITGEDVIGDIISVSDTTVSVNIPLRAHTTMHDDIPAVQLVRYMMLGDLSDAVDFNAEHVLAITTPMQKALDYYNKIVDNMDTGTKSVERALDGTHQGFSDYSEDLSVEELIDLIAGKVTIQ